jgi:O-succinylbenzoic acid--CoA ligase
VTQRSAVRIHLSEHAPLHSRLETSRGVHAGRPTLLLGLEFSVRGQPREAWAEACPLPGFGEAEDQLELAKRELGALEEDLLSGWVAQPALVGLDATLEAARQLRSAAARHALEWVSIEALACHADTGPAELLHAWLRRIAPLGQWPALRQVIPCSAVLDPLDSSLRQNAALLAEQGILTWKLKCGRDALAEERAVAELARLDLGGQTARLRLDPGSSWTLEQAREIIGAVQTICRGSDLRLEFIEDPTPDPAEWGELALLAPLAADEVLAGREQLLPPTGSSAYWVLKPMVHGVGGVLELARRGHERGQRLVLSHAFDGALALRTSSELASILQDPGSAAGLGPHLGLAAFRNLDLSSGLLLRGERRGPSGTECDVLLDSGRLGRRLRAQPLPHPKRTRASSPTLPAGDGLSLSRAATLYGDRTLLDLSDRALGYAQLWDQVQAWTLEQSVFVPIVAEPTLAAVTAILAAFERQTPALLLHPSWSAEAQQNLVERAFRHAKRLQTGDAIIVPTSGSSGEPHLVVHTRASLLAAVSASATRLGAPTPETRWLLSLPLSHVGGLSVLLRCVVAGAVCVVNPLPKVPADVARLLKDKAVTHLSVVPTQLRRWLEDPAFVFPATVECVLVGGAHASPSLRSLAASRQAPVVYSYGMTEMASQVATEVPRLTRSRPTEAGVGTALPTARLSVSADGRLCVGGPMLMRTYLDETAPLADGLFTTGDAGRLAQNGELTVMGRVDDLIVTGGENVAPSNVESVLAEVPGVLDVCVLGCDSDEWGKAVVAVVVPDSSAADWSLLVPILEATARAQLPSFARPKVYLRRGALPLLPSGKVDRRRLSAELVAEITIA